MSSSSAARAKVVRDSTGEASRLGIVVPVRHAEEVGGPVVVRGTQQGFPRTHPVAGIEGFDADPVQPFRGGRPLTAPGRLVPLRDVLACHQHLAEIGAPVCGMTRRPQGLEGERLVVEKELHHGPPSPQNGTNRSASLAGTYTWP